jgi:hypothetical protein
MLGRNDMPQPPRAFEVDASWYQSYWYAQAPQSITRKSARLRLQLLACFAVLCAGAYFMG